MCNSLCMCFIICLCPVNYPIVNRQRISDAHLFFQKNLKHSAGNAPDLDDGLHEDLTVHGRHVWTNNRRNTLSTKLFVQFTGTRRYGQTISARLWRNASGGTHRHLYGIVTHAMHTCAIYTLCISHVNVNILMPLQTASRLLSARSSRVSTRGAADAFNSCSSVDVGLGLPVVSRGC